MNAVPDETITLKGGFVVPLPALQLAWKLEELGIELRVDGDDLVLRPRDRVPPEDLPALRKYRRDLMRIIRYEVAV